MEEKLTCCLCQVEYCSKKPEYFKEKGKGGTYSKFRRLSTLENKKFLSTQPNYKGEGNVGKIVCLKCRKRFKNIAKKRKMDDASEIFEKQRLLNERNEKRYQIESKLEADGIFLCINIETDKKYSYLKEIMSHTRSILKDLGKHDATVAKLFFNYSDTLLSNHEESKKATKRAPPENLLDQRPTQEQIEYMIDNWEWIELNGDVFRDWCLKKDTQYKNMSNLRVGFEKYLERTKKIKGDASQTRNLIVKALSDEEVLLLLSEKDQELMRITKEFDALKTYVKDFHDREHLIMEDKTLSVAVKSIAYLKKTFGVEWDQSFLNLFIRFMLSHAMNPNGNGIRYDQEEFNEILTWLKTASVIGHGTLYQHLRGDGNSKESDYRGFNPKEHNLCIPSLATIKTIVTVAHGYSDQIEDMDRHLVLVAKELVARGELFAIVKFDGMYLKKTLQLDVKKDEITGLQGGILKGTEWISLFDEYGVDIFQDAHIVNQSYAFIVSSLDKEIVHPYYHYGLLNDDYKKLLSIIAHTHKVLKENGIILKVACADGGASCRKALQYLLSDVTMKDLGILPFTDLDHLLKTIRNKTAKCVVKVNGRTLDWKRIHTLWGLRRELQDCIEEEAFYPERDKMQSSWMREILCNPVLLRCIDEYVVELVGSNKPDEARAYEDLGVFLNATFAYLHAWESKDQKFTHDKRYEAIYDVTELLLGRDKAHTITGLTQKALDGLTINVDSWLKLITFLRSNEHLDRLNWRAVGTMALENFFSKMRAVNPNPTYLQFQQNFAN
jgi:hypothetical protein